MLPVYLVSNARPARKITESFEQSGALREDYQSCLESLRKDGERRLADVNRRIKRQRVGNRGQRTQ